MRATVKKYNKQENYHEIVSETGDTIRVDLFVNGDLPESVTNESIVGKRIEIERTTPYLMIGYGVEIVE